MHKYFVILLVAVFFVAAPGIGGNFPLRVSTAKTAPVPAAQKANFDVEDLILEKQTVHTWCPVPERIEAIQSFCRKDEVEVKVHAIPKETKDKEKLTFFYTVSGGRVIGQGANVIWSLAGARPGTHSITVGVGKNGKIRGKTVTKTLEFNECPDCLLPCICPSVSVSGGGRVPAGETVTFKAHVSASDVAEISYKWEISEGEMMPGPGGQNSSEMTVRTSKEMIGKTITATVKLSGFSPACNCHPTAFETATVIAKEPANR